MPNSKSIKTNSICQHDFTMAGILGPIPDLSKISPRSRPLVHLCLRCLSPAHQRPCYRNPVCCRSCFSLGHESRLSHFMPHLACSPTLLKSSNPSSSGANNLHLSSFAVYNLWLGQGVFYSLMLGTSLVFKIMVMALSSLSLLNAQMSILLSVTTLNLLPPLLC